MCRPYFGQRDERGDRIDLSSLALQEYRKALGVVVNEIHDEVDIDSDAVRQFKYGVSNMTEHDINNHLGD